MALKGGTGVGTGVGGVGGCLSWGYRNALLSSTRGL